LRHPAEVNRTSTGVLQMTNDDGQKPEGAPERSPKAGVGAPSGVDGNGPKRFSVRRITRTRNWAGMMSSRSARSSPTRLCRRIRRRARSLSPGIGPSRPKCHPSLWPLQTVSRRDSCSRTETGSNVGRDRFEFQMPPWWLWRLGSREPLSKPTTLQCTRRSRKTCRVTVAARGMATAFDGEAGDPAGRTHRRSR
jgi:hypothetical protein